MMAQAFHHQLHQLTAVKRHPWLDPTSQGPSQGGPGRRAPRQDEVSSWDFHAASRKAETFVRRLWRRGVTATFVDDGARGSGGIAEMESKLQAGAWGGAV